MNDVQILDFVQPYTVCSTERILNVLRMIEYVHENNIPGDFVEVGVFKGGIVMAMALKCKQLGIQRNIYAYDTFTGMTAPTNEDMDIHNVKAAVIMMCSPSVLCVSSLEETQANVAKTEYPHITFCVGDVLQTDLTKIPKEIAILRLDTDWYESTKFELEHFEPHVAPGGFVIVDDYGHWQGSRKAVDEFLQTHPQQMIPIDYTGIFWRKQS